MSKYVGFPNDRLKSKDMPFSPYQELVNQEPFDWCLQDVEVQNKGEAPKTVKSMRLSAVYYLLDSIYFKYNTKHIETRQIGRAISVTVRLITVDLDGVIRYRDGTGFVEAEEGVRNATSMADANAIKNAAKKLGRIFGRDLYADDEVKALKLKSGAEPLAAKIPEENFEPVIQREEEGVNPNYVNILAQLKKVTTPEELKMVGANVIEKYDKERLDDEEFGHLTDLINQTFEKLKKQSNAKKTQTKPGSNGGKVSQPLHGRTTNATANKGGKRGGGAVGNGKKTTRQSSDKATNKKGG